jgi:excinuclease UvrABC nuclease subunit
MTELKESNGQLKQRLQDASDNLMPQLEREKQQAAKSRNFKEAAQIKD